MAADKLIFGLFVVCAFVALVSIIMLMSKRKGRDEVKKEQAEEANERNKDIARLQAADASPNVDIRGMLRRRRR